MTEDPRISKIRAVLDEVDRSGACEGDGAYLASQFDRIRAILDSAPPAPRVFLPGDTVPADVALMSLPDTIEGPVVALSEPDGVERRLPKGWGPALEIRIPSPEEWQAAIDQAEADRATAEWQHTEGTNP